MTAKDKLRQAVEELSELEAEQALAFITRRQEQDPVLEFFDTVPEEDEPLTPAERASVDEAWTRARRLGVARRAPARARFDRRLARLGRSRRPARPARLDPPVRNRVLDALERLIADPPTGDVIKLQGRPEYRLRVGDWRLILRLDDVQHTIHVLRVLPRGRAYER